MRAQEPLSKSTEFVLNSTYQLHWRRVYVFRIWMVQVWTKPYFHLPSFPKNFRVSLNNIAELEILEMVLLVTSRLRITGDNIPRHASSIHCEINRQHRYRSRQIFGVAKEFCQNSPKLARRKIKMTSKKSSSCQFGRHFFLNFQEVCEGSQRFCWIFTESKLLGVQLHPRLQHQWSSDTLFTTWEYAR